MQFKAGTDTPRPKPVCAKTSEESLQATILRRRSIRQLYSILFWHSPPTIALAIKHSSCCPWILIPDHCLLFMQWINRSLREFDYFRLVCLVVNVTWSATHQVWCIDGGDVWAISQLIILDEFMRCVQWDRKSSTRILPCDYFHMMVGVGTSGSVPS